MSYQTEDMPSFYAEPGHDNLLYELDELDSYELLSSYAGSVVQSCARESDLFIVRTPGDVHTIQEEDIGRFHNRIAALYKSIGQECLEQLVSYSLEPLKVVTKYAPGKNISELGLLEVFGIKVSQFGAVINALENVRKDYIVLDTGGVDNALYHPRKGFTLIDYSIDERYRTDALNEFLLFLDTCLENAPAFYEARRSIGAKALAAIRSKYPDAESMYPMGIKALEGYAQGAR